MSDVEPDDPDAMPIISIADITAGYDLQTSIVDELLGGPLDLSPSGAEELATSSVDATLVIHPHRGTEQAQIGWTRAQLEASLGPPDSVHDGNCEGLGFELGIGLNYTRLGLAAEIRGGLVVRLTFHSGTYSGGLLPLSFEPYAGVLTPDMSLTETAEPDLLARLGAPESTTEDDHDLAELLDERRTKHLVYPGWGFKVYDDGALESVSVPKIWIPL